METDANSNRNKRRPAIVLTVAGVIIVVAVVYSLFDPAEGFFPRCPVKMLTGYDCPGCGSQRALHALLGGDFAQAWRFNPMVMILAPYAALTVGLEAWPRLMPRLRRALTSTAAIVVILIAIIVWTVLRNVL